MVLLLSHQHPLLDVLAANVRSHRKARGWSRRDLAERADISERFLADVEAAQANPSLLRVQALATTLDVELSSLLGAAAPREHIALLGLRGAGKSTVGPLLADRMAVPFVELDHCIVPELWPCGQAAIPPASSRRTEHSSWTLEAPQ